MSESPPPRPEPARPPVPPTPARELTDRGGAPPTPEPEAEEATLTVGGSEWRVRVLGRSGRSSPTVPPLLLLGFGRVPDSVEAVELEATVVGRSLDAVSSERLEAALARASPPPDPDRRRPFFEATHGGRKGPRGGERG